MNNTPTETGGRAPDKISQSLPVPEYKMGWIIGKRGSYINQLAKKSGASISVSDSTSKEYGTVWKYVQITGSGRAVDRAKKLLHIRLERLEPRLDDEDKPGLILNSDVDEADSGDIIDGDYSMKRADPHLESKSITLGGGGDDILVGKNKSI
jgi:predicted PilT family ATPase